MGYFDGLIDFKTTIDGKIIYYPNSFWGKGFEVPNLEKKQEIQKSAKRLIKITFFSTWLISIGLGTSIVKVLSSENAWQWILVSLFIVMLLIGIAIWHYRSTAKLTHGLTQSKVRFSILERWTTSATSMNFILVIFVGLASLCFAFTGFLIAQDPQFYPGFYKSFGIVAFLFGCSGFIAACYMIVVKIKLYLFK